MNNGFLDDCGMPDLQKLVELFGDYSKITPEAWAQWDAAVSAVGAFSTTNYKPIGDDSPPPR